MASKRENTRLIYFGMGGPLSAVPLAGLLEAGYTFCAAVIAAPRREIPWRPLPPPATVRQPPSVLTPPRSVLQLAWEHGIDLFEVGDLESPETHETLQHLSPDVALVSCFAYRIPARLLARPQHGFFNLHPSLLPEYRGPHPIFWQLRDGLREIGVTVHRMDEGLDSGPIAMQETVSLRDGMQARQIDALLGEVGGRMFDHLLEALAHGKLSLQVQPSSGSYQGRPQARDFTLDRRWSARRAYNFMRGTSEWGRPYSLAPGNRRVQLRRALDYDPQGQQPQAIVESQNSLKIQFNPGILEVT